MESEKKKTTTMKHNTREYTVYINIDPFTVYVTGKFEVRSAHVGV